LRYFDVVEKEYVAEETLMYVAYRVIAILLSDNISLS